MESEAQDDVRQPGDRSSAAAMVDESKGNESHEFVGIRSVRKENENLTGRAYEYFHKLQQ